MVSGRLDDRVRGDAIDRKQNRRHSDIWMVPADGSREAAPLTASLPSSNSPRWSPDGRAIAFLSARPWQQGPQSPQNTDAADVPKTQVRLLPLADGEPRRLTSLRNGVSSFAWSPDGARLVCVGRSGPSDTSASPSDVRHYAHPSYKSNDSGWFDDKRAHLWVVGLATGVATQVTSGDAWNDSDPQWSPDGTKIAFVSDRTGKAFDDSIQWQVYWFDRYLNGNAAAATPDSRP